MNDEYADRHEWLDITDNRAANEIHDRMSQPRAVVPTGLDQIDRAMWLWGDRRGIPQGTYCIIGGASNVGKTQSGLYLARQAAIVGERTAIIMLDMKRADAVARLHQALTVDTIPWENWIPSRWKPEYETVLKDALHKFRLGIKGSLGIHSGGNKTIEDVERLIREAADIGVTFFIVDHMQKIKVLGIQGDNVAGRAEIVSERMDDLSDELNVTIVALSQLNRFASSQNDRSPNLHDLWGGTAMESNAGLVIMLDHSRYKRDDRDHHIGRTFWILSKNQLGPKGFDIPVEVNHATLEFREAMQDELAMWPTNGNKGKR